jgi:hypothetical protein
MDARCKPAVLTADCVFIFALYNTLIWEEASELCILGSWGEGEIKLVLGEKNSQIYLRYKFLDFEFENGMQPSLHLGPRKDPETEIKRRKHVFKCDVM